MALSTLINRPCILSRRLPTGSEDAYGNVVPNEQNIETLCEIQQRRRDEPDAQGEFSDTEWLGFFLPADSVHTGDVVTVDSEEYEVVGEPWRARNPRTKATQHTEATLRRTAGDMDEVGS